MLELIGSLHRDFGMNIVLSSHLIDEVERVCDRVVIIGGGRTMAEGTVAELRGTTAETVTAEIDADGDQMVALVAALTDGGLSVRADGRRLVLSVDGEPEATAGDGPPGAAVETALDQLRDVCLDHGLGIIRLGRRRLSLEDVFLEHLR